jgi:hypothetical protein
MRDSRINLPGSCKSCNTISTLELRRTWPSEFFRLDYTSIQTGRVILKPGPDHEVAFVRKVFEWYGARGINAAALQGV